MNRSLLDAFTPLDDAPLVVEFVSHARENGLQTRISFDFWDFELFDGASEPVCVVKSLKKLPTPRVLEQLLVDRTPFKVLLVENEGVSPGKLADVAGFLAMSGAGLYVRSQGWLVVPGKSGLVVPDDLELRRSKRWRRDEQGAWRKACVDCGEERGPEGFYRRSGGRHRDPYRDVCKSCWAKRNRKAREARA